MFFLHSIKKSGSERGRLDIVVNRNTICMVWSGQLHWSFCNLNSAIPPPFRCYCPWKVDLRSLWKKAGRVEQWVECERWRHLTSGWAPYPRKAACLHKITCMPIPVGEMRTMTAIFHVQKWQGTPGWCKDDTTISFPFNLWLCQFTDFFFFFFYKSLEHIKDRTACNAMTLLTGFNCNRSETSYFQSYLSLVSQRGS